MQSCQSFFNFSERLAREVRHVHNPGQVFTELVYPAIRDRSSGQRRTPQFRHGRSAPAELAGLELALLDLLRQLDADNGDRRVFESFKTPASVEFAV